MLWDNALLLDQPGDKCTGDWSRSKGIVMSFLLAQKQEEVTSGAYQETIRRNAVGTSSTCLTVRSKPAHPSAAVVVAAVLGHQSSPKAHPGLQGKKVLPLYRRLGTRVLPLLAPVHQPQAQWGWEAASHLELSVLSAESLGVQRDGADIGLLAAEQVVVLCRSAAAAVAKT